MRNTKAKRILIVCLLYFGSIFVACLIVLPLVWMLVTSFKPSYEILRYPPTSIPKDITFSNYVNLFTETDFPIYLANSFFVSLVVVVITNIVAIMGAYSLTKYHWFKREKFASLTLYSYMWAPIMIAIPLYILFSYVGMTDTRIGLIVAHVAFCFPFALWLLLSFFKEIPEDFEEAAMLDGANFWQRLFLVFLPSSLPGIITTSTFIFILSWNDYIFARILISSDSRMTIPVGIQNIYESSVTDWGMLMAAGVITTFPVLIAFIFVQKFLLEGLREALWG